MQSTPSEINASLEGTKEPLYEINEILVKYMKASENLMQTWMISWDPSGIRAILGGQSIKPLRIKQIIAFRM